MRRPAMTPPAVRTALARGDNPADFLQQHYQHVWLTRMHDMPFVNPALAVETIGFERVDGDWLGVVVTPWFLNLFLVYGGGSLWRDTSAGQRSLVTLPCGVLEFIADDDPDIGLYQYCPLIAPVSDVPDMATARQAALDALQAVRTVPVVEPPEQSAAACAPETPAAAKAPGAQSPRRDFFRRLGGRG